jgi:hypothetical protein
MSGVATDCVADLITKLKTVTAFGDKVLPVLSEEDLTSQAKLLKNVAVGVFYEGMTPADGKQVGGMAATLACTVAVLLPLGGVGNADYKGLAAEYLDAMRAAVRLTTSPTGHRWVFALERPAGQVGSWYAYVQRWTTVAILTN